MLNLGGTPLTKTMAAQKEDHSRNGAGDNTNNTYSPENGDAITEYDELHVPCPPHTTERRLKAKIDLRVVPFLIVLYLLAFLDRVNIANARSFSLVTDLGLTGVQYNTALTIFFVPYIVLEIPSNIMLKRLGPRIWIPACCLGFGLVSVCQGLTQNYGGLLTTRFFLGVCESGMFPGCFYLLRCVYPIWNRPCPGDCLIRG